MRFFLGTHKPNWLADERFRDVPLFVSRRTLSQRKTFPRAKGAWALDSGGFTELQMFGGWRTTEEEYVDQVRRIQDSIGGLLWAAPMDWMCEPIVISGGIKGGVRFAGTGLSVREHQKRTVENLVRLRAMAPDIPFIPVLQGWDVIDYRRCDDMYAYAGIDLRREPVVGVGTMCRRQSTKEAVEVLSALAGDGVRLHGFGFKLRGIPKASPYLVSADSLSWSMQARNKPPIEGHDLPSDSGKGHKNCANCAEYALRWYHRVQAIYSA